MSETRKITIEILNKSQVTHEHYNHDVGKEKKETGGAALNKLLHPVRSLEKATVGKNVFINQVYQQAKQAVSQTLSISINRYFNLSEDYITENSYKNTMTTISKAKGAVTSVIGGAMAGGVVGGIVAAVGWAGSEILQNQAALSSYYQSINATSMQTEFSRTRAGLVDNGRGTEN